MEQIEKIRNFHDFLGKKSDFSTKYHWFFDTTPVFVTTSMILLVILSVVVD